ncbi:hypothetical protein F7P69_29930 [Cellulosimicrobium funkei]|nr:hypothetical protein [Cellulosimicrobium funkei]
MTRSSARSNSKTTTAGWTHPAARRRRPAAAALGLGVGLVLTGCGSGTGADPSETAETSTPVETVTQSPRPTASATVTETASATPSEGEDPAGATQTYTSEAGHFSWTFPETWSVSQEDYSEEFLDYLGVPHEVVLFQDPEMLVEYRAITGVGPTDNDGAKPEVVEVLEAEELPDVPVSQTEGAVGSGPVWYRASIYRFNEHVQNPDFEDGELLLAVQVVNIDEGLDPEATDDSFWSSWFYEQPPVDGGAEGTATFLSGSVTQDSAEEVTGLEGEEAMRAFLETEEYGQLRSVATSVEVSTP